MEKVGTCIDCGDVLDVFQDDAGHFFEDNGERFYIIGEFTDGMEDPEGIGLGELDHNVDDTVTKLVGRVFMLVDDVAPVNFSPQPLHDNPQVLKQRKAALKGLVAKKTEDKAIGVAIEAEIGDLSEAGVVARLDELVATGEMMSYENTQIALKTLLKKFLFQREQRRRALERLKGAYADTVTGYVEATLLELPDAIDRSAVEAEVMNAMLHQLDSLKTNIRVEVMVSKFSK